jgi:hypothetical protein
VAACFLKMIDEHNRTRKLRPANGVSVNGYFMRVEEMDLFCRVVMSFNCERVGLGEFILYYESK